MERQQRGPTLRAPERALPRPGRAPCPILAAHESAAVAFSPLFEMGTAQNVRARQDQNARSERAHDRRARGPSATSTRGCSCHRRRRYIGRLQRAARRWRGRWRSSARRSTLCRAPRGRPRRRRPGASPRPTSAVADERRDRSREAATTDPPGAPRPFETRPSRRRTERRAPPRCPDDDRRVPESGLEVRRDPQLTGGVRDGLRVGLGTTTPPARLWVSRPRRASSAVMRWPSA